MERIAIQDARKEFAEVVEKGSVARVVLTKYGRGVACLIPLAEGKLLERLERSGELPGLMERYPEDV